MSDDAKQGVFGIDLGTTYSAVAYIDDVGKPVIARNSLGRETTPSVIYFENESNVVVGETAKETAKVMPDNVVSLVKRQMGNADFVREFFGREYSAPALSALILKEIAQGAETDSSRKLEQAVITVPAYFGMLEKSATRQAGELAGIQVIGIVPEPVAAALSYGLGSDADSRTILVYDLGGGTFDVTVIRLSTDEIRVLAVDGNHGLGGADWDEVLVDYIVGEVCSQLGDDAIKDDDAAMQEIWNQAEKAKQQLSQAQSRKVIVRHVGGAATVEVSRARFEELTKHLVDQTVDIAKRALATLEEKHPGATDEIDDVLLVGGSSKMPAVAAALKTQFGWDAKLSEPDLAVAKGAALYAAAQWGKIIDWQSDSDAAEVEGASGEAASMPVYAETEEEKQVALARAEDETKLDKDVLQEMGKRTIVSALPKAIGIALADTSVDGWDDPTRGPTPLYVEHLVAAQAEIPFKDPVTITALTAFANAPEIEIALYEQAGAIAGRALEENRLIKKDYIKGLAGFHLPAKSEIEVLLTIDGDGLAVVKAREPKSGKDVTFQARIELLDAEAMATARQNLSVLTTIS
jgi:molecular chaperone DnaK (HSP70)